MNTYAKYAPNVFVAKCTEQHEKNEEIVLTTQYGKEHECIVFNYLGKVNDFYYYSIVRADGFNYQEWAKQKAERLTQWANSAENKSNQYFLASNEGKEFLSLGEPIKIGHHSEHRHRALIQRNYDRMGKCVELGEKAEKHLSKSEYYNSLAQKINLSMPESIEYYNHKLEEAKKKHEGLKNGTIKREHSFSLTYANKEVKELEAKVKIAAKLWADNL